MTSVVWRIRRNTGMKMRPQLFLQVQAMQAHEAGAKPEHIGDEERWAPGNAAPVLALDEVHGDERKDHESAPVKPMGQHKRKAGH